MACSAMISRFPSIVLELVHAGQGERGRGFTTGWRRLPALLLETPLQGSWQLEFETGESFMIRPHQVAVVTPESSHRLLVTSSRRTRTAFLLLRFSWQSGLDLTRRLEPPTIFRDKTGRNIARVIAKITGMLLDHSTTSIAKIHAQGFHLLAILTQDTPDIFHSPPAQLARLQPVLTYIHENLNAELDRAKLARLAHISPTRFHTVFRQTTGFAPMQYVQNLRLARARELLIRTDQPIWQIAENCGFSTIHYFCRVFGKHTGQTPTGFRQAYWGKWR